jgi:hypothetical protein
MSDEPSAPIDDALSQLCDGRLSDSARRDLMASLRSSKSARDAYIRQVSLHFWLRSTFHRGDPSEESPPPRPASQVTPRPVAWLPFAVAAALAIAVAAWFASVQPWRGSARLPPPVAAVITGTSDCRWSGAAARRVGDVLRAGDVIELASGAAELLFDSRTRLVTRGPVAFVIVSSGECDLRRGEVVARVLAGGRGFRVTAGSLNVIDRGTEFGVRRSSADAVEVEVFDGEVALCDSAAPPASGVGREDEAPMLTRGQTARIALGNRLAADAVRIGVPLAEAFMTAFPEGAESEPAAVVFDGFSQGGPDGRIDKAAGGVGWASGWRESREWSDTAAWVVAEGGVTNDRSGVGGALRNLRMKVDAAEAIYAAATLRLDCDRPRSESLVWLTLFRVSPSGVDRRSPPLRVGFGISAAEYFCGFGSSAAPVGRFVDGRPRGAFAAYRAGRTTRMVAKVEIDVDGPADRLSVWVDPPQTAAEEDVSPAHVVTGSLDAGGLIDKIALRFACKEPDAKAFVDDVRFGRSWSAVAD